MLRIIVASDKFKGTLSSDEVAAAVREGVLRVRPDAVVGSVPVADGGEGTLVAAVAAGFELVRRTATGPTGELVHTGFARRGETAVVELADVSGLSRLVGGELAPMTATSRGTGELIAAAIDSGCTQIIVGIGGSACTDGGAGLVRALGARILDANGQEVPEGGAALATAKSLELTALRERLAGVQVVVACDVDNPLTGQSGAAAIYAPQKGASPAQVEELDAALTHWANLVTGSHESPRAVATTGGGLYELPDSPEAGGVGRDTRDPAGSAGGGQRGLPDSLEACGVGCDTCDPAGSAGVGQRGLPDSLEAGGVGRDFRESAGAGAAGGVGFAALALLGAELRPGIDLVLDLVGFHQRIEGADLVITGEGALDEQTLHGKAVAGVAAAAREAGIPVVAVCGVNRLEGGRLREAGIWAAYALTDLEADVRKCIADPVPLVRRVGERIALTMSGTERGVG